MSITEKLTFDNNGAERAQRLADLSDELFRYPVDISAFSTGHPEFLYIILTSKIAALNEAMVTSQGINEATANVAAAELDILLAEHGIGIDLQILDDHQLTELEKRIQAKKEGRLTLATLKTNNTRVNEATTQKQTGINFGALGSLGLAVERDINARRPHIYPKHADLADETDVYSDLGGVGEGLPAKPSRSRGTNRGPGHKTAAQRNARAAESAARRHREG